MNTFEEDKPKNFNGVKMKTKKAKGDKSRQRKAARAQKRNY